MREIEWLIVHHSASIREVTEADISRWHTLPPPLGRGWRLGTGYQRVIESDAKVLDGRKLQIVGAHCKGWNQNSIGICVTGDNTVLGREWTPNQEIALAQTLDYFSFIWPKAKARGHRDMPGATTLCPGIDLVTWLETMNLEHLK